MQTSQPTPNVTTADVERVVRRDFPADRSDEVISVLSEYGTEKWEREADRVRLAVLKLANRDLSKLRYWLNQAKLDYRDVLSPAEYPRYRTSFLKSRAIAQDWAEYQQWLNS